MKVYQVVLIALLLMSCSGKKDANETIRPVFYQKVEKTTTSQNRSFSGVSQAAKEAKLSFKVGGTIDQLNVELGDVVKKGTVIASLDTSDYLINYNKAILSLRNAEVQYSAAHSGFQRVEKLYAGNNASLTDYEKSKAQFESAEAMVKTAQSQVKAAKNQLDYTRLVAPFDGTISAILADENEMTSAGRPIVVFSSTSNIEVRISIPENMINQIEKGQLVTISFITLPGESFQGMVNEISPGTQGASSYPVIIQISEPSTGLLPGMTGNIQIPLHEDKAHGTVIVAPDAISHDQDGDFVFLADKSNEPGLYVVTKRVVNLGDLTSSGYEVTNGLEDGEIVITAGIRFLYEGRTVKLIDQAK